jgi:hypothetical protein
MKYFTLDWWFESDNETIDEYTSYIGSIRAQLPANLARFIDTISLHDAQIIHFHLDIASRRLEFLLAAWFPSDGPWDVEQHTLRLVYEEVISFRSTSTPDKALGGPTGYGELGYDEVELLGDGLFEHRLLFSSGIELQIRFRHLHWQKHN